MRGTRIASLRLSSTPAPLGFFPPARPFSHKYKMQNEVPAQSGPSVKKVVPINPKSITFRRDDEKALKFSGERIGSATRENVEGDDGNRYDVAARLYKTTGGKYVFGVEVYDKTAEYYEFRDGVVAATLEDLWTKVDGIDPDRLWLDDDILGQVFEATELADRFVEVR